jgi:oligo-1,6-glucosidase
MDVINMISKDPALPDGPVLGGGPLGDGSEHYLAGPRIHEFLAEMHREVFAGRERDFLTVGEMPGATVEQARLFTDPARAEVDMIFTFEHVNLDHGTSKFDPRPFDLRALKETFGRWQTGLADVGWTSLYWNNHDQPRVVSRFGDAGEHRVASAKALATLLHLHRGTPYVYQGEELGMANPPFAGLDDFRDIESLNHYSVAVAAGQDPKSVLAALRLRSRDNARTPVQWDASPSAGFTTGTPWIAVNPDFTEVNAQAAWADPDSVLHHYRRLIELRHTDPTVVHGDFTMLLPDSPQVYAFTRASRQSELLVVVNVSSDPAEVGVDAAWAGTELVIGTHPGGEPFRLRPWEARVHRRRA